MPERPRFEPWKALFPAFKPPVPQSKALPSAGPLNSDTASIAGIAIATVRSAFPHEPPVRLEMRLFKHPRPPGLVTTRLVCSRRTLLIDSTGSVMDFGRLFCINVILPSQHLTDKL